MMNQKRRIIAYTFGSYPYGGAHVNRQLSYLRGLAEKNADTKLLVLAPDRNQEQKSNKKTTLYYKVLIKYCAPILYPSSKFSRYINLIIGVFIGLVQLFLNKKRKEEQVLLLLFTSPLLFFAFLLVGKVLKYRVYHERTEYPFINKSGVFKTLMLKWYYHQLKRLDGLFVITEELKVFFSKFIKEVKIKHILMMVEPDRFNIKKSKSEYGDYIAYCGSMYTSKDGVPILIEAFDKIAQKIQDINLVLIGDNREKKKFVPIQKKILSVKNKDRIILTGQVNKDQMPELLCNAKILALARPDNIQAKGGFPTKLGEYLSTGNPVVVTKVGEITQFLIHCENAYLAEPDNVEDFGNKIDSALSNEAKSRKIGLEGKKLAMGVFNYKVQATELYRFFFKE